MVYIAPHVPSQARLLMPKGIARYALLSNNSTHHAPSVKMVGGVFL